MSLLSLLLCLAFDGQSQSHTAIRAAIDIGMSGPKLQVAEVDAATNKIIELIYSRNYFVNFYESEGNKTENLLSSEAMSQGLKVFKEAIVEAYLFNPEGIVAFATASLRHVANGEDFANEILNETGIKVHIIDQNLEGQLAFEAILAKIDVLSEDLVVWDVGGGSVQLTTKESEGSYLVECVEEGVGAFVYHIIENIQQRNVHEVGSPNPMSAEDILLATDHARHISKNMSQRLRDKLNLPTTKVVGAGSVFGIAIEEMVQKNPFTIEDLTTAVQALAGKTDADFGGGFYAFCQGADKILVLGYMQDLHIQQVQIVNVNNADGALVYAPFWPL
jgi:exopolyphosphatase/guanosine-5'-triphosphate,3'-diphosphate pyrophosphatase